MGHLYLYCLYMEIEEKTTLFTSIYYSNWELRKTFASKTQNWKQQQHNIRKIWRKFNFLQTKNLVKSWCSKNRRVKNVRTIYRAPSTAEFWILKTREIVVSEIETKSSNSIFLHSTTNETADGNAKKWSSSSYRDRPGGSHPGPNHDNITLED